MTLGPGSAPTASGSSGGSPSTQGSPPPGTETGPTPNPSRQRAVRAAALTAVVVVVIVLVYALSGGFHPGSKSRSVVLVPQDDYYSLPGEQYNAISFIVQGTSVITGTFTNTLGVVVYVLDPSELAAFNHNGTVGAYEWSSGEIANLSVYQLDTQVPAGQWSLTFVNPNVLNTTVVGFYTAVVLAPA